MPTTRALASAQTQQADGGQVSPFLAGKNLIMNGDMMVAQRGTSFSFASGGGTRYYAADRWQTENYTWSSGSNITVSQETSVVPTGFKTAAKWATGGTGLTFASGGVQFLRTSIEGYNISRYYSNKLTLSFWVRSSTTGTYNLFLENGNWGAGTTTRAYAYEYTINAANTWEKKSLVIDMAAATAAGTWGTTSGFNFTLNWVLGAHADRTGNAYLNSWTTFSSYHFKTTNAVNLATIANSTFYLTGVQLEAGEVATPFSRAGGGSYGNELLLCQRYYQVPSTVGHVAYSADGVMGFVFPVTMRATPAATFSYSGTTNNTYQIQTGVQRTLSSPVTIVSTTGVLNMYAFSPSGWAQSAGTGFHINWTLESEL